MKITRREASRISLQKAIHVRSSLKLGLYDAVCPYDCAASLGLEVHFDDIPSLEGMYVKGNPPIVLISSLRPPGRAAYTCAHEIGHHVFNHGTCVDEHVDGLDEHLKNEEEILAQTFAGFFLMPKSAVEHGLHVRGKTIETIRPMDIYTLACWFGVGYSTLINHAEYSLRILPTLSANALRQVTPRQIRLSLIERDGAGNLIYVDQYWKGRAIDVQVGDSVLLPRGTVHNGDKVQRLGETNNGCTLFQVISPGIDHFSNEDLGWAAFVRVSRRNFVGRGIYRHLEEAEDE